jgi:NitT/TauT family transport system substrate-binding protein
VTDLGSGIDELTQFIASKAGVKKTDYQTIAVHARATAIAALQRGSPDCVMTTQPTVGALESQKVATSAIDLASTKGAKAALGGAWPAAGLLAQESWVNSHKAVVQKVVTALTATMNWIHTHTAQDVANKLPKSFVQNATISKADYVKALTQDYGQFLPDGLMPTGGPKTVFQMENAIGVDTSNITHTDTFTNAYVTVALKQLGITPTSTPTGAKG